MAQNWEEVNSSTLQVLEYLNKKGYSKSEAMLRMESSTEGGPLQTAADEPIGIKYMRVFGKSHKLDLRHRPYINAVRTARPNGELHRGSLRYLQGRPLLPSQMWVLTIDRRI